jgi:hypothetical protein
MNLSIISTIRCGTAALSLALCSMLGGQAHAAKAIQTGTIVADSSGSFSLPLNFAPIGSDQPCRFEPAPKPFRCTLTWVRFHYRQHDHRQHRCDDRNELQLSVQTRRLALSSAPASGRRILLQWTCATGGTDDARSQRLLSDDPGWRAGACHMGADDPWPWRNWGGLAQEAEPFN